MSRGGPARRLRVPGPCSLSRPDCAARASPAADPLSCLLPGGLTPAPRVSRPHRLSPAFMLHFVEGLPHSALQRYAFPFEGAVYRVAAVVQYKANNHFITWVSDADGECRALLLCSYVRRRSTGLAACLEMSFALALSLSSCPGLPPSACLCFGATSDFFLCFCQQVYISYICFYVFFRQTVKSYVTSGIQVPFSTYYHRFI